jgi:hypothetical protein
MIPSEKQNDTMLFTLAVMNFLLHVIVNATTAHGYFRDEFYYIACSEHLAFGYVDQPPLSILLLAINRFLFGDSLVALRIMPALAAALTVFLTGKIAAALGGNRFAQSLAALCSLIAPQYLGMLNFFSMNAVDLLFWTIAVLIVVNIMREENPKLWLSFGVVAGLGAQNKFSILFLCFGIAVGLLLTSERTHLRNKWFWLGATIAAIIFLPHVIWQIVNNYPTLEFVRNATLNKNVVNSPLEFLSGQIMQMSPFTFPIWGIGLWYFFFSKKGKPFRLFGWSYLAIFALFVLQRGKVYYISPIYPILFAGGSVAIAEFIIRRQWYWLRSTIVTVLALSATLIAPYALPVLPVEAFIAYVKTIGIESRQEERHEKGKLPQHYADMFGWEEKVAAVARAYHKLSPEEQATCALFTNNYGRAAAIDFFGKKYGLPKAISNHNNYWLWGPRDYTGEIVIILGGDLKDQQEHFESVEVVETVRCEYCMPYENNLNVYVCRGLNTPLKDVWQSIKSFN